MNAQRDKMRLAPWELRIGIHTGPVMAGVVGKRKFTYDIWGDAVNIAARMETNSEPGRVNVSDTTWHRIKDLFDTEHRGPIEAKNKGRLEMYFLNRIRPDLARDDSGRVAGDAFADARRRLHV